MSGSWKRYALLASLVAGLALAAPAQAGTADRAGGEAASAGETAPGSAPVDVNRAAVDELVTVPGIGPALARRIVEHRQSQGPFRSVDELLAVRGIGPKKLEKLRPHVVARAQEGKR